MLRQLIHIGPTVCLWGARAAMVLILVMALLPSGPALPYAYGDKILHFLAYGTVAGLLALGRGPRHWGRIAIGVFGFSILIEALQAVSGAGRDPSGADLVANLLGTIAGLSIGLVLEAQLRRHLSWRAGTHSAASRSSSG